MRKAFHVVTGLPRSGSTLLCNLLSQNPDFYASSTSPLAQTVGTVANVWTASPEIKSELAHDTERAEACMVAALRGLIEGWYLERAEPVVFDKGRGWMALVDRLHTLCPATRLLCCVRDPREVFASIQKHHLAFPLLDEYAQQTIDTKASGLFAPDGMIGGPLTHIEDQIKRKSKTVVPVVYEDLVEDPERTMRVIYGELKMDYYPDHDFEDVQDMSTDLDALYLGKFPHEGGGKVEKPSGVWQDFVPAELGQQIVQRYPLVSKLFGYA